jgi:rRNA maturation endonuclease Nob1
MSINQGIAQVIEVYHGNQALVSNTTGVITAKVADEIKKAGQRFNVKTEDGSALDKGKMQEVLASEKQKLTEKQKTNREKIRSSIPNEETVTSVFEVLRGAANTTTPTQGRLRSKIKQNIGADLLNKA